MRKQIILLICILSFLSYAQLYARHHIVNKDSVKAVIMNREKDFNLDVNKYGVMYAFEKYADENAVIKRGNDSLIYGKKAIANYYSKSTSKKTTILWKPDFIEVSDDGTLAYTYGKYTWEIIKNNNEKITLSGVFHTVWKRNKNGEWFYVWD